MKLLLGGINKKRRKMEIVEIIGFDSDNNPDVKMPLFQMSVSAGVPVSVENEVIDEIDLNEFLVENPVSTFFVRVKGKSAKLPEISDDDILVVDEKVEPKDGKIVVAAFNGELTVKIYREIEGDIYLESAENQFLPVDIEPYMKFYILGTVTRIIHSL